MIDPLVKFIEDRLNEDEAEAVNNIRIKDLQQVHIKRALLREHYAVIEPHLTAEGITGDSHCNVCFNPSTAQLFPCTTLKIIASEWINHPDCPASCYLWFASVQSHMSQDHLD